MASQVVLVIKNPPANAGDGRDVGLIPESEDPLEEDMVTQLQYSCLENPTDRGAWWATVHRIDGKESDTTEQLTQHKLFSHIFKRYSKCWEHS